MTRTSSEPRDLGPYKTSAGAELQIVGLRSQVPVNNSQEYLADIISPHTSPKISSLHILQYLRRNSPDKFPTGPVHGCHADQHPAAVEGFTRHWLGDDKAERLIATHPRWQIINARRPIREVQRDPFAVADARSVPDEDILKVRLVYPDHEIDILEVKAPMDAEAHRWYFKDRMGPRDVFFFFTQFDSTSRGDVPKRVPHNTAFRDPRVDEGAAEARKSIEFGVAVFYESD